MNWLAHVFLSEPDIEFQLGNLLADIVRGEERLAMSERFRHGAQRHHAIDAFTDRHSIVRRSRQRIRAPYRRFSGVFVDIFYDHVLATNWERYAPTALEAFTSNFYANARASTLALPQPADTMLDRIVRYDLLGSYVEVDGVARALRGVSIRLQRRWGRDFALQEGVADLIEQRADFAADFAQFFPELRAYVDSLG